MRNMVFAILALFVTPLYAQGFATSFESTEVSPGIHMIYGVGGFGGGNVGLLLGEDYVVMIDDSLTAISPLLQEQVSTITGRPVNFMINTHLHGDHVGGNTHFAAGGTVIFAHENIRNRLLPDPAAAGGTKGLPVVTFGDGVTFHLNNLEARVMHLPNGHTDGDAWIHFPQANVIHTGDLEFHEMFPFIDLNNGGSVDGYLAAQEKIWSMADSETKIIPGHGELTDKAGMRTDIDMLKGSQARVRTLFEQGMTEDEVVAANPLADYHDVYNWRFITTESLTRTIYQDMAAGK